MDDANSANDDDPCIDDDDDRMTIPPCTKSQLVVVTWLPFALLRFDASEEGCGFSLLSISTIKTTFSHPHSPKTSLYSPVISKVKSIKSTFTCSLYYVDTVV